MSGKKAIKTAIQYEQRARDFYVDAEKTSNDSDGKRFFGQRAREGQRPVNDLAKSLGVWLSSGHLTLDNSLEGEPSFSWMSAAADNLLGQVGEARCHEALGLLKSVLAIESETNPFYRQLAMDVSSIGRKFFNHFAEIENGHLSTIEDRIRRRVDCGNPYVRSPQVS